MIMDLSEGGLGLARLPWYEFGPLDLVPRPSGI